MKKKQKTFFQSKPILYLLFFSLLFIGYSVGLLTAHLLFPKRINPSLLLRESGYEFINPLIDFDNIDFIKTREARDLEKKLNNYVKREIQDNYNITHISIYYRDMNTGVWIGINESEKFSLASLTKVPIMITHYKYEEKNPGHLQTKFIYEYNPEIWEYFFDDNRIEEHQLEEGNEYTIDEFIDQLIIHSDNTVLPFLHDDTTVNEHVMDKIFFDLGITNPYFGDTEEVFTVREYSAFFRILYNSTYLSKEMSSKALETLARSSYDDGLAKGIPEDIVLANKFGERTYEINNQLVNQLHDCGIIYHPQKPYNLCVMTRGKNPFIQERVIAEISRIVYNAVDGK